MNYVFHLLPLLTLGTTMLHTKQLIEKHVLDNGLTVLVRHVDTLQDVSIQLWYNVGSKDEQSGQKGLAHLIEHMIFKGTDKLSESDIPLITHKLSGNCNATTSFDWTRYLFDVPLANWKTVLPIMADCMRNCTFKEEILNAELKVVIQELKMYNDKYTRKLFEKMLGSIFSSHPYHYPVIGYKHDLWNLERQHLIDFYHEHYIPNNATLIVVGNVDAQEVFAEAQKAFGHLQPNFNYKKPESYLTHDICSQTVTLYRDVTRPVVMLSYVIPGIKKAAHHIPAILELLLTKGKDSLLNKLLVEELALCSAIGSQTNELFDADLLSIIFEPHSQEKIEEIINIINTTLQDIAQGNIADKDLKKAINQDLSEYYDFLQSNHAQAATIGKFYLATGNPEYVFTMAERYNDLEILKREISQFATRYLRPSAMHKGMVLPMAETEKEAWHEIQKLSDQEDARVLDGKVRTSDVEDPKMLHSISAKTPEEISVPKPTETVLQNGLKILSYRTNTIPKVEIALSLPATYSYEPKDKPGIYTLLTAMMIEGTKNYPGNKFAAQLEELGMGLSVTPGAISMSMLSKDLAKGIELFSELLYNCTFDEKYLEKNKKNMHAAIDRFQDDQHRIANQLLHEHIYPNHPYSINRGGTHESIDAITIADLIAFYGQVITPDQATVAVVGDFDQAHMEALMTTYLSKWKKTPALEISWPQLNSKPAELITKWMNRDQIVIYFGGLSIDRMHEDYEKLKLFDQIFGAGMNSRLFELREKTGAFYTISGSTSSGAGLQPGMVIIKTIVSLDKYDTAVANIRQLVDTVIDSITQDELDQAKRLLLYATGNIYSNNDSITSIFNFLHKYNLGYDYFERRNKIFQAISLDDVKAAARKVLQNDRLSLIAVGRIGKE